ncbi:MAG: hypothetical protein C5B53_01915 [Candidatus Melainabacteria bacterium]|nr:MAG: hypothetical protein C5B53_01915 [Candidatus Melainabacteria bacterium]
MFAVKLNHHTFRTNSTGPLSSTPPVGIGCLKAAGNYLLINNIGRNLEIALPRNKELASIACYSRSTFSDDQEAIDFDLDMHALIYNPAWKRLLTLNHNGRIRMFNTENLIAKEPQANIFSSGDGDRPGACLNLEPEAEFLWKSDVEHSLLIGNCLVSSSPLGYRSCDPAEPGLLVSRPIEISANSNLKSACQLEHHLEMSQLGSISALAIDGRQQRLALASDEYVYLFNWRLAADGSLALNGPLWPTRVPFRTTFLAFGKGETLVAGGYQLGLKENELDPSSLTGGGYALINTTDGVIRYQASFKPNLAWGTSAQCLTLSKDADFLLGVDRHAGLYGWSLASGAFETLFESAEKSERSLGIAHLAWLGDRLYCGFNRDGNRLHVYEFAKTEEQRKRPLCRL